MIFISHLKILANSSTWFFIIIMSYTIVLGEDRSSIPLNSEQLDGIISAWEDLYTKACGDHLEIYLPDGSIHPYFSYLHDEPYHPFKPSVDHSNDWTDTHLLLHEREFFNWLDYPYSFVYPGKTWHECLRSQEGFPNIPLKRFTFVGLEYPIRSDMQDPMITNQQTEINEFNIRHCDNLDYIQGYIALCNWTKAPWQDHIKLVHDGDTPFPLTS